VRRVDFHDLRPGDRVVVWDPAADALHTEATVIGHKGGRIRIDIGNGLAPADLTPRQAARFVFRPEPVAELRELQESIIASHIDHQRRMLVLREGQLRETIDDESMRAEALIHSSILAHLKQLHEKVASGSVLK
jgi:hypothetical protein